MKIGTLEKRKRACRIEVHISGVRRNSSGMEFMMELINNVTKAKCTCRTQGPQCCRVPGASVKQRACKCNRSGARKTDAASRARDFRTSYRRL